MIKTVVCVVLFFPECGVVRTRRALARLLALGWGVAEPLPRGGGARAPGLAWLGFSFPCGGHGPGTQGLCDAALASRRDKNPSVIRAQARVSASPERRGAGGGAASGTAGPARPAQDARRVPARTRAESKEAAGLALPLDGGAPGSSAGLGPPALLPLRGASSSRRISLEMVSLSLKKRSPIAGV